VKFAIRDDDPCYFTAPEELARVYDGIWETAPVCFAVIPFAKGYRSPAVPTKYWETGETYALERNADIVSMLRELTRRGRGSVALHGYTHEDFPDGWEFQAAPDPDRRMSEGRAYLERLLETRIAIFVPPHNALSKAGLAAADRQRLNLLGSFLSFHPRHRPWDSHTAANWWRVRQFRARTGRQRSDRFVYPYLLRYSGHSEFGCHSLIPGTTLDELVRGFEEARAAGGDFCVATHYWEVDDRMRGVLVDLIAHASRYSDVRFVKAEELFA
jgi:hypothetical protein